MRRKLIILALGCAFLAAMTWIGTILVDIIPARPTAALQTAQAGPYQLTLQVEPNPPPTSQPATLSIQVLRDKAPVSNAYITLEGAMEAMDMGKEYAVAQEQSRGLYSAPMRFSMSGAWRVRVQIALPGARAESAVFAITAQ
ncbi:hypothetical protein EPA93_28440 [Ktedonosporobacter rubrisoli]|uniref:YtkA-like domain-containing protein n=1 Tax=Ktedonosporobacter rubrisoli TaxID=2509675 RepID=A0A4P6JW49_KTERU|nr:FixH family protein [Ktedonosporobacter rubrisoli]QBD79695.1 hypothetical protein EPA93_28440 [Ktedonosporobacter rubrisoli]